MSFLLFFLFLFIFWNGWNLLYTGYGFNVSPRKCLSHRHQGNKGIQTWNWSYSFLLSSDFFLSVKKNCSEGFRRHERSLSGTRVAAFTPPRGNLPPPFISMREGRQRWGGYKSGWKTPISSRCRHKWAFSCGGGSHLRRLERPLLILRRLSRCIKMSKCTTPKPCK